MPDLAEIMDSKRVSNPPTWMIREQCDTLLDGIEDLLAINTNEIDDATELARIAQRVKSNYKQYLTQVDKLINNLGNNGQIQACQDYFGKKKSLSRDVKQYILILDGKGKALGADSISNVDTERSFAPDLEVDPPVYPSNEECDLLPTSTEMCSTSTSTSTTVMHSPLAYDCLVSTGIVNSSTEANFNSAGATSNPVTILNEFELKPPISSTSLPIIALQNQFNTYTSTAPTPPTSILTEIPKISSLPYSSLYNPPTTNTTICEAPLLNLKSEFSSLKVSTPPQQVALVSGNTNVLPSLLTTSQSINFNARNEPKYCLPPVSVGSVGRINPMNTKKYNNLNTMYLNYTPDYTPTYTSDYAPAYTPKYVPNYQPMHDGPNYSQFPGANNAPMYNTPNFTCPTYTSGTPTTHLHSNKIRDPLSIHLLKQELLKPSSELFEGDPAKFNVWMSLLRNRIKHIELDPLDIISIYSANTKGAPRRLIDSYLATGTLNPDQTLNKIETELSRNFGSSIQICSALRRKVQEFPTIRPPNVNHKLKEFSLICRSIEANMTTNSELAIYNLASGQEMIWSKLPEWLTRSWFKFAHQFSRSMQVSTPTFDIMVNFIEEKADELNNPNFQMPSSVSRNRNVYTTMNEDLPTPENKVTCLYHNKPGHSLVECNHFAKLSYQDKQTFVKQNKLCFRCLGEHLKSECPSDVRCSKCCGDHSFLLHYDRTRDVPNFPGYEREYEHENPNHIPLCSSACGNPSIEKSCSKVVLTDISHHSSPSIVRCYAIIDEQSNSSYLDPKLTRLLNVSGPSADFNLTTMSGYKQKTSGTIIDGLVIKGVNEETTYGLPSMTTIESIPNCKNEVASPKIVEMFPHVSGLSRNFLEIDKNAEVLVLLGRDSGDIMKTRCYGEKAPFAHHTSLGWALVGSVCPYNHDKTTLRINHEHINVKKCFPNMPKTVPINDVFIERDEDERIGLSREDQKFIDLMVKRTHLNDKGNLAMPLPFKDDCVNLPDNKVAVFLRTKNTLERLKTNKNKLEACISIMSKNIQLGHVEKVPSSHLECPQGKQWFLPMFPITNPKKEKPRLVFDSSAQYKAVSLNRKLLQGPDCTNKLRGVLFRFRIGEIGFTADIESMFYCFYLDPADKPFVKFFWFDNNDPEQKLVQYWGCVHLFGNKPSPAIANYGLNYAVNHANKSSPEIKKFVSSNLYVDDALGSSRTSADAVRILKETRESFSEFNIRLHKIASNSPDVLSQFPTSEIEKGKTVEVGDAPVHAALGLSWNLMTDELYVRAAVLDKPFTRRGLVATVNSLYDPLGIVGPVLLKGKLIQRQILSNKEDVSASKMEWDDPLPESFVQEWNKWKHSVSSVDLVKLPRSYIPNEFGEVLSQQLHVFADASLEAIGTVAYLQTISTENKCHVSFLSSRSKLVPRAATSIPRAELCAALEASNLKQELVGELSLELLPTRMYTDSMVTLGYLNNNEKGFSNYVTNRVFSILKLTKQSQWIYVNTKSNPADIASRSHTVSELRKSMWTRGPEFLWNPNSYIPDNDMPELQTVELPEMKELKTLVVRIEQDSPQFCLLGKVGSWSRAVRSAQHILSFIRKIEGGRKRCNIAMAVNNPNVCKREAELWLIRGIQHDEYNSLIRNLKNSSSLNNHPLSSLNPFLDVDDVVRVGGRLRNSSLPLHEKHPIILPKVSRLTNFILEHYHQQVKHQGRHLTMATIRQAGYFVHNGSKLVKDFIRNCVVCRKLRAPLTTQLMADIPHSRLTESPPFTHCGLDVFGHFDVRVFKTTRGRQGSFKMWSVLFTCMVSRGIHLEPLYGLDISSLKHAIARFTAVRGASKHFYSDRGTNFIGTDNQQTNLSLEAATKELGDAGIEWHFNAPHASHHGGPWERKIGAVRKILEASLLNLKTRLPTLDEFTTFLAEASNIVNNTPMSPISADPREPFPICPANLITMKENPNPPSLESFTQDDILAYGKQRWRRVQYLADCFWEIWRKTYLQDLQERRKWTKSKKNLAIDDVVLMRDKKVKRNHWPMAIVTDVKAGLDNLVRTVTVRSSHGNTYKRPITELVLIVPASPT